jgi:hypothetical protein
VIQGSAKAWVTFVGSTASISGSFNISSVTRASTGDYTVNFTTSFVDANYTINSSGRNAVANSGAIVSQNYLTPQTTSSCRLYCINDGGAAFDSPYVSVAFHR